MIERLRNNRTTATLVALQVLVAVVAFLVNLISANAMNPSGRGALAFYLQIAYLLSIVFLLGIERPYVAHRRAPVAYAAKETVRLALPGLTLALVPVSAGIAILFTGNVSAGLTCLLIGAFALGNAFSRLSRTAYLASRSSLLFAVCTLSGQAVLLTGSILLGIVRVDNPLPWLGLYTLTGLIAIGGVLLVGRRARFSQFRKSDRYKRIRSDGLRLIPASLGNTAMLRSDRLLLPLLASNAQLGIYVVVATVMELATWPIQNWVDASLSTWKSTWERGRMNVAKLYIAALTLLVVLTAVIGVFAYFVITLMLGKAYEEAVTLIIPLAIAGVFYGLSRVQQGLLLARGRASAVSISEFFGMALSVVAYVVLIPFFGALGAAIGSIAGYGFCCVIALLLSSVRKSSSPVGGSYGESSA